MRFHQSGPECAGEQPLCDWVAFHFEMLFYVAWGGSWALVTIHSVAPFLSSSSSTSTSTSTTTTSSIVRAVKESALLLGGMTPPPLAASNAALRFANAWASISLFAYGPMLILWVVFYSLAAGLTPAEATVIYARYNIGIIYHCGVLSCHVCTFHVSLHLEAMVASRNLKQQKAS